MIKMTNEEIKKSLLLCSDLDLFCKDCPYHSEYVRCNEALCADARDLIIKQEQEIAQLKDENVRLTTKLGQVLLSIDTVKEMNAMCNIEEQVKQAKIDVLNELKERIRTAIDAYWNSNSGGYYLAEDVITDINNTIEEYKNN